MRDRLRNWGFNVASSDLELSRLFESGKDAVAKGNSWENAEYNNVDDFGRRMSLDDGTKIIRTHKKQKPKTQVEPNLENRFSLNNENDDIEEFSELVNRIDSDNGSKKFSIADTDNSNKYDYHNTSFFDQLRDFYKGKLNWY